MISTQVKWRIHLGSHKTATTHLQDIAEKHCDELSAMGIQFIPRSDLRKKKVLANPGHFHWRHKLNGWPLLRAFHKRIQPLLDQNKTIVLSEENFLGCSEDLLSSIFYMNADKHLQTLHSLSQSNATSLFLAIRPQSEIIPSAYVEAIRSKPPRRKFSCIKKEILNNPPSWVTLIQSITEKVPGTPLSIWTMKDYLKNKETILSHLFGVDFPPFEDIRPPSKTKSPSAEAIKKIEEIEAGVSKKEYQRQVTLIVEKDQGKTKFTPFTEEEITLLTKQYDEDILAIKRLFPDVLLDIQKNIKN